MATIRGTNGADIFQANPSSDRIIARGGPDSVVFGAGADTVLGGAGQDELVWVIGDDGPDKVDGGKGIDTGRITIPSGSVSFEVRGGTPTSGANVFLDGDRQGRIENVENMFLTTIGISPADVTYRGGTGVDVVSVGTGTLDIETRAGDDRVQLFATDKGFRVDMGAGDDILIVSANFAPSGQSIRLDGAKGTLTSGGTTLGTFQGVESLSASGTNLNDRMFGGAGSDVLTSLVGADRIKGRGGDDVITVTLDTNRDSIDGGTGHDRLVLRDNATAGALDMTGTSSTKVKVSGGDGKTILTARRVEEVDLIGTGFDDLILGLRGDDTLEGGAGGTDTLRGGRGDDTLGIAGFSAAGEMVGGLGSDTFRLNRHSEESVVTIRDFSDKDFLSVRSLTARDIESLALVAGRNPAPTEAIETFLYDTRTGILRFDGDGTGPALPSYVVTLRDGEDVPDLTIDQLVQEEFLTF